MNEYEVICSVVYDVDDIVEHTYTYKADNILKALEQAAFELDLENIVSISLI